MCNGFQAFYTSQALALLSLSAKVVLSIAVLDRYGKIL